MKTKIAVDLDNVIAIHHDLTVDVLNSQFKMDLEPDDITDYDYASVYLAKNPDLNEKKVRAFCKKLFSDPDHLNSAAVSLPMIIALRELSGMSAEANGITIITARPADLKDATRRFIDRHGIAYQRIVHTEEKGLWCRQNTFRYLIEDAPHHIEAARASGIAVFVMDQPYNRSIEATGENGLWRVTTPPEIPDLIRKDSASQGV